MTTSLRCSRQAARGFPSPPRNYDLVIEARDVRRARYCPSHERRFPVDAPATGVVWARRVTQRGGAVTKNVTRECGYQTTSHTALQYIVDAISAFPQRSMRER